MIQARLTNEMREMLKKLKNAEFFCYSALDIYERETLRDGKICMQTSKGSIKIYNKATQIPWFKGDGLLPQEEIFSFNCEECAETYKNFVEIRENISKIEVITDYIKIVEKDYEIALDMALVICTKEHQYMISRDWLFDECLNITVDKNYNDIYPIERVVEEWNNFGEWDVEVKRVIEQL